ncbi:hypothetical protein DSCA_28850 [Desulfosarcina alkanivorans]|uniref:(S)-ureidoglycine aminohydrolase cupin domain-containing protein n=1 Tax=Desulfosarcina alkanivorans TaxID=571177 RepID=A0A5K7YKN1_9BACT|nr:cupin domain-containing protein [Desulfosarcina alkanivorans]BBO68955.1 hypothetical protein DSCA_28850 [Desulfosarcina alkanivorans]
MHMHKNEIPIKISAPGAVARQKTDFGDASGFGVIGGEHFTMDAGVDIAPLLRGLENDLCDAPHWGYLIQGALTVTFRNGDTENVNAGDLFYWPPGHTVKADQNAEFVLFSPQREHTPVMDHINRKLEG